MLCELRQKPIEKHSSMGPVLAMHAWRPVTDIPETLCVCTCMCSVCICSVCICSVCIYRCISAGEAKTGRFLTPSSSQSSQSAHTRSSERLCHKWRTVEEDVDLRPSHISTAHHIQHTHTHTSERCWVCDRRPVSLSRHQRKTHREKNREQRTHTCVPAAQLLEFLHKGGLTLFDLDHQDQSIIEEELTKDMWAKGQAKLSSCDMSVSGQTFSGWGSCGPQKKLQDQSLRVSG